MNNGIELWHLVLLLLAFFGFCAGVLKLLFSQLKSQLDERFQMQEAARRGHAEQLNMRLDTLEQAARADTIQWQRVERELLILKADLPLNYVLRPDYVQAIATIMAKLDAMALRFENILLKGQPREH